MSWGCGRSGSQRGGGVYDVRGTLLGSLLKESYSLGSVFRVPNFRRPPKH